MVRIQRSLWAAVSGIILSMLGLGGPLSMVFADHPAYVAGQFYPENPLELRSQILEFLAGAGTTRANDPSILIVPHAGYVYSGRVAGQAFRQIQGKDYPLVLPIAVAHRYPVSGAATQSEGAFQTPLGSVSVDTPSVRRLMELSTAVAELPGAFYREHSLEVELPFLQVALGPFKLLPLLMSQPDPVKAQEVGEAVAAFVKEKAQQGIRVLIVISSDFAHYPSAKDAKKTDLRLIQEILKGSPEGFHAVSHELMSQNIPGLDTTACGQAGILAGLYAARAMGNLRPELLRHATSAESPEGDSSRTVGYAALVFYEAGGKQPVPAAEAKKTTEVTLTAPQKNRLLALARQSAESYVRSKKKADLQSFQEPPFQIPRAVFVTITKHGELRGCIGSLVPQMPLAQAVAHYAVLAASEDHRFAPVDSSELGDLRYEVSILTDAVKVPDTKVIRPGIDGVILIRGPRQGVFLPQVWAETGWTKEEFLSQLSSQKAGLPRNAWKDPETELFVFQVDAFKENVS